jgi:hypothetical protein
MADTYYTKLPLRAVVEVTTHKNGSPWENYECGHGWYAPTNPYTGRRPAKRRRCAFCGPVEALHVETEQAAKNDARDGRSYV